MWIDDWCDDNGEAVRVLEPREVYDPCAVAVVYVCNEALVVYDAGQVRAACSDDDWFSFNIAGSSGWALLAARAPCKQ